MKFPTRNAFGDTEIAAINECINYYKEKGIDPGYQGIFEKRYTDVFCQYMGGGYADAVATGTTALYVAIAALDLPAGSDILVSPITDPGTLSAIILQYRLTPRLMDSKPNSYNIGIEQFLARITPFTRAVVVVHSIGYPVTDIQEIVKEAHARDIHVIEDCSQSHGARVNGHPVGSFGDMAAFSTMYRKAHVAGSSGGVVYTRDRELYRLTLAHADRGKPSWNEDFNDRDPRQFLFPALNLHTDEISCSIGIASLARLDDTILKRLIFIAELAGRLNNPYEYTPNMSPFVYPIIAKREIADALLNKGIPLNPHYQYVVSEWPWIQKYLSDKFDTPNARDIRDRTFCLYLNENYGLKEAAFISTSLNQLIACQ